MSREMEAAPHSIIILKSLHYTDQEILTHSGQISHEMTVAKAHDEFEKYRITQDRDYLSDFDQAFAKYLKGEEEP